MVDENTNVATPSNEQIVETITTTPEPVAQVQTQTLVKEQPVQPAKVEEKDKVFTQAQLDDIVVARLSKEKARMLKKLGLDDESGLDHVVEKANKYQTLETELSTLKAEKVQRQYADILGQLDVDSDFTDYVLTKVDKGENTEQFIENAKAFIEANPKLKKDNYKSVNSGLDLGGEQAYPDFSSMTPEQYLAWRAKNKL